MPNVYTSDAAQRLMSEDHLSAAWKGPREMGEVTTLPSNPSANIHHRPSHRVLCIHKRAFWEKCLSCTMRVTVLAYFGQHSEFFGSTTPSLKSCSGIFPGGVFKDALSSELLCRYCAQKLLTWKIDYRNKDIMK